MSAVIMQEMIKFPTGHVINESTGTSGMKTDLS